MGYLISIKVALILFPILAFLITLPYMIANYRKYGSVNKLRTLIFYSFILYLLTVYFLVILPLPNPESVHTTYAENLNLIPFSFVADFIKNSPFILTDSSTWIAAIKHPTFYVPAFNVLMLIPFGIYLRYYFKCSLKKTLLLTAILSLFFELTQLSGLYFIYSGPYRLADVDDIIQNTIGGYVGYFLGWFATWLLPSREEIDEKSLEAGSRVSATRVSLSLIIDAVIIRIPYTLSKTQLPFSLFLALKFGLTFENKKWIRTIFRGILLTIYFRIIPAGLFYLADEFNKEANSLLFLCLFAITFLAFILFVLITIVVALFNRRFMFDRLSGANYESTIQVKQEK